MKYVNGKDIFPTELLEIIQDYCQGQYVYIPKSEECKEKWGARTSYKKELSKRNSHIYTNYLMGLHAKGLVEKYNLSEKSIKRIIYEKRKGAERMKTILEGVLKSWGIKEEIQQIYDTVWSVGDNYVVKSYENLAGLKRNIEMMRILDQNGIPVANPIPTKDEKDFEEINNKYYLMMNKLKGTHILDIYKEDYEKVAYETGTIVAKLHKAFIACEQKITFWNNSLVDEMRGWIRDIFLSNNFRYISEDDFKSSFEELTACYDNLPRQLIHRDMHYGNILFYNGNFSGYIDFDLSQKNVRIFDICYFLMGLLVEHHQKEEYVVKWYNIVTSFIKGYEEISQLTSLEKSCLSCLMQNIELLFVAYFIMTEDEMLASKAADLYYFVKKNKNRICYAVNG